MGISREEQLDQKKPELDYATPSAQTSSRWGGFVRGFGMLAASGGIAVVVIGFNGPDEWPIILIGFGLTAFGILCAILGQILHTLEAMRG